MPPLERLTVINDTPKQISRLRFAGLFAGIFLPTLTLVPLGSLWLWQNGYLLHWALATLVSVAGAALLQRRILGSLRSVSGTPGATADSRVEASWTPSERGAWLAVEEIAKRASATPIDSRDAVLELGEKTIRAVANRLHPEVSDPLWQFTVPEAFALMERVSRRLGAYAAENVPLGDRLTVAQILAAYRWRGALGLAEKAYDVWRFARLVNPVTAATHELRERISKQLFELGRTHVTDRLVDVYVKEVGRAAIDLYGGRLRVSKAQLQSHVSQASKADSDIIASRANEPLRVLVVGSRGSGKSSLVRVIRSELSVGAEILPTTPSEVPYKIERSEFANSIVVDTPGLDGSQKSIDAFLAKLKDCDLLLFVAPAHLGDRQNERSLIAAARAFFEALPHRLMPPTRVILTHADLLQPIADWNPPYDEASQGAKADAIRAAVTAASGDFGVASDQIVVTSLRPDRLYNIDAVIAMIVAALPDAYRAKLVRQLADSRGPANWRTLFSQARGAARVIAGSLGRK